MKTVLITGISRGIGKALAQKFLSEGYFVLGTSTKGKTSLDHQNLTILKLDLTDSESIENCANEIINFKKPIDILINNAGTWLPEDKDPKKNISALRKVLETNLIGPIDFTERIIPLLNLNAHVVNISSRQGSLSYPPGTSSPSYKISKAGLNMFTRILSYQLKGKATVSSVHPGAVMTDMALPGADMSPEEAALYIYDLAISKPETGQFWFKGEKFPW